MNFFEQTYEDSREGFVALAQKLLEKFPGELCSHEIPSPTQTDLKLDILYLPPMSGTKKRLLILTSGIHGIEGFVGSALQRSFMDQDFWNLKDENLGLLIIHGINPFGFKTKRRVTENNVDLNRNFDVSDDLFKNENPGYTSVRELLMARNKKSRASFYLSALFSIKKFGKEALRRAIVKGQYHFPDGIFFGGKGFEPQVALIKKEVLRLGEGYEAVHLIDLHTGYGQRGKLHLFGDRSPFIDQDYMNEVFKGLDVDYGQEKDFYEVSGGFTVYLAKILHKKTKYAGVCFEFGTIDSHKTLGSLDSLYRMVHENHRRDLFVEMFYPSSSEWREGALKQFQEQMTILLRRM